MLGRCFSVLCSRINNTNRHVSHIGLQIIVAIVFPINYLSQGLDRTFFFYLIQGNGFQASDLRLDLANKWHRKL
jgi:hypothetical protein